MRPTTIRFLARGLILILKLFLAVMMTLAAIMNLAAMIMVLLNEGS